MILTLAYMLTQTPLTALFCDINKVTADTPVSLSLSVIIMKQSKQENMSHKEAGTDQLIKKSFK